MINFMSNEDTLDTTDESEVLQTRDGWSLQRCKGKEEIWSPHRWHFLSPKVGRLNSRSRAWQEIVPFTP